MPSGESILDTYGNVINGKSNPATVLARLNAKLYLIVRCFIVNRWPVGSPLAECVILYVMLRMESVLGNTKILNFIL